MLTQNKTNYTAKNENHYRLLLEAVEEIKDYAIFLLDPKGYVLTWNAGAERIKGYSAQEIIGRHFSTFYTEEDLKRQHPWNELRIAEATGRFEEEGWRVRKDGTKFWANVLITRLSNGNGELAGFSKVTRDLTDKRLAEEALRKSEDRFRQLIEDVKDYAIFLLDPKGFVTTWNRGAERLNGYASQEIIGQHFSVFYPPEEIDSGKCEFELEEATLTGRYEDEGWRVRKDGTRFWASVIVTALRDPNGKVTGFSKVTRDLTERRQAEERLRRANEDLERRVEKRTKELTETKSQLERAIRARDEFLGIASHEFKSPITSLKLQADMLARAMEKNSEVPPERIKRTLTLIARQMDRLTNLVDYLLDATRAQLGRFTFDFSFLDLSKLVTDIAEQWEAPLEAVGSKLTKDIESGISGAFDGYRLEQVLANLLSNIIKYAPQKPANISLKRVGDMAEIVVSDSGPGIPKGQQGRIFERFERGEISSRVAGFGLGLYLAKAIVEAHKGSIQLQSDVGVGSTFTIRLPLDLKPDQAV